MVLNKNFILLISFVALVLIIKVNYALNDDKNQEPKCLLPMEPGPCRMSLSRFYYNAKTDTCEKFIYGGCKGNDNRFGFKHICEAACKKQTTTTSVTEKTVPATTPKPPATSRTTAKVVVASST